MSTYSADDILEAARVIRLYLPDLLETDAQEVDSILEKLLTAPNAEASSYKEILELLAKRESTREWTRQFLTDKIPPSVMRHYSPITGTSSLINASTFSCPVPDCPRIWHRPKQGIEPPSCPEHHIPLVHVQLDAS